MTDKLCLLLYLAAFACLIAILITAQQWGGNPYKLIKPVNLSGQICGDSSGISDKKYGAMPNPYQAFGQFVCVSDCQETFDLNSDVMAIRYQSTPFLRYCLPISNSSLEYLIGNGESVFNNFNSQNAVITRSIGDIYTAYPIIIACIFISLGMIFIYLYFLRLFTGLIIWSCILLCILAGFFLSYSFLQAAEEKSAHSVEDNQIKAYKYTGYTCLGITIGFTLIIIALRKRIQIAIEIIKLSARAFQDLKGIFFVPLPILCFSLLYFVLWIYIALYIFSVNTESILPTPDTIRKYSFGYWSKFGQLNNNPSTMVESSFNIQFRPYAAFHFFHLLWSAQFGIYYGYLIISGAVCNWYFTEWNPEETAKKSGFGVGELAPAPVVRSFYRTTRYHLGTIAFASLIIAIVQFLRAFVHYIERQTRGSPPNIIQKILFCLLKCFLWCLECCLDKISRNALIWTAIWGDSFLRASCSSFALIWRNLFRVAALAGVEAVIFFIGKIAIALGTAGLGAIILIKSYGDQIQSAYVPTMIFFLFGYIIAGIFFILFETVVDSMFFCFLVDSENSEHEKAPMCAPKELIRLVGAYGPKSVAEAQHRGANVELVKVEKSKDHHNNNAPKSRIAPNDHEN